MIYAYALRLVEFDGSAYSDDTLLVVGTAVGLHAWQDSGPFSNFDMNERSSLTDTSISIYCYS